jgi:hypothetical protein
MGQGWEALFPAFELTENKAHCTDPRAAPIMGARGGFSWTCFLDVQAGQ